MKVYYLGPQGSFSYLLAKQHFADRKYELVSSDSFEYIAKQVASDPIALGVLPIENSTTSNVHENIEHIFQGNLKIIEEAYLAINLHLVGLASAKLENVRKVLSHPKALEQCSDYTQNHELETVKVSSTAEAATMVVEENSVEVAAIGSSALADTPELLILDRNIGNEKRNLTRFVIVNQKLRELSDRSVNKISLNFKALHKPGALASILQHISSAGGNLTYIQSKPISGKDFHYNFWIDVEADGEQLSKILEEIKEHTLEHSIVGCYSHGARYES